MFGPLKTSQIALPAAQDLARISLEAIISGHPVPEEGLKKLCVPEALGKKLQTRWAQFKGPVDNLDKFKIFEDVHESRLGYVILAAKWERCALDLGVVALNEDDDVALEIWLSQAHNWPPDIQKTLEILWTEIKPVQSLKAQARIGPNAPCPCNSGRKYKKCCGRFA